MRTQLAALVLLCCGSLSAWATPFVNPIPGPAGDGSFDPGYAPKFTLFFNGSLWTVDTDLDGLGDEGVLVVGDRKRAIADGLNATGWNPGLSQRAFNVYAANGQPDGETAAAIVGNDPFPSWDPDTPDADPDWVANYGGSERYGFEMAVGAGLPVLAAIYDDANDGDPDSNGGLLVGDEWAVGLWPWVNNATRTEQIRPYSGVISSFVPTFTDLGPLDRLDVTGTLTETDGAWNNDFDGLAPDDEDFSLANSVFSFRSTMFETGNIFEIPNPLGGGGMWRLNEWAGMSVINQVPEPTAVVLLGLSVAGLAGRRWRRSEPIPNRSDP